MQLELSKRLNSEIVINIVKSLQNKFKSLFSMKSFNQNLNCNYFLMSLRV